MKMKTSVSVLIVAALTLLMTTLLFKEVSATCRQRHMITDKSINVQSPVEAAAATAEGLALWQSLQHAQPNSDVPKPPSPHKSSNVHSSIEAAAAQGPPGLRCSKNIPKSCPPSRPTQEEQQVKVNGKAEITSINAGKQASAHYTSWTRPV
jgi:hypothetical protein